MLLCILKSEVLDSLLVSGLFKLSYGWFSRTESEISLQMYRLKDLQSFVLVLIETSFILEDQAMQTPLASVLRRW